MTDRSLNSVTLIDHSIQAQLTNQLFQFLLTDVAVALDLVGIWNDCDVTLYEEDVVNLMFAPHAIMRNIPCTVLDSCQVMDIFHRHLQREKKECWCVPQEVACFTHRALFRVCVHTDSSVPCLKTTFCDPVVHQTPKLNLKQAKEEINNLETSLMVAQLITPFFPPIISSIFLRRLTFCRVHIAAKRISPRGQ